MCVYVGDSVSDSIDIDIGMRVNVGVNVDKGMQVGAASTIDRLLKVLRERLIHFVSYHIISYPVV